MTDQSRTLEIAISLPKALPWQERVLTDARRFNVLVKGRRAGGTLLAVRLAVEALLRNESVGWFSATYKLLDEARREIRRRLGDFCAKETAQTHRFECYGGGTLEMWSLDGDIAARGRKYNLAIIDEAAFVADMRDKWEQQIRPCLADLQGAAWFVSSPNGHNYLHTLWELGQDDRYPEWASWQLPTWDNPRIAQSEIESARGTSDESNFRQEWGAEFVTRSGAVFPAFRRDRHVREIPADPDLPIHVGIDFGFRSFAAVFFQVTSGGEVHVIGDYEAHEATTDSAIAQMLSQPFGNGKPFAQRLRYVGCDPAGSARNLQTGRSDVQVLSRMIPSAAIRYQVTNPEWRAARIRDLLFAADGTVRLYVDPGARRTIRAIENSVYPAHKEGHEEKAEPVKDGVHDHMRDALGFGLLAVGVIGEPSVSGQQVSWL